MGVVNFGINKELVANLAKKGNIKYFVETGTYLGGTSIWASKHFDEVHTIEISEEIYNSTSKKYKDVKNVFFYLGDSKNVLPEIMPKIKSSAVFWLDGHWCGRNTGGKNNECPIFDELNQAIKVENPVILIDDLRYFLGPNPFDYGENYPTLHSIINFLNDNLPNHFITFHDETLICVPNSLKEVVDADWQKFYSKRYPTTVKSMGSKIWWRIKNLDFTLEKNR
jgi:hypothetical protein